MTEQERFIYENHKVNDTLTNDVHSSNRVSVNVLNELHEENEELKKENKAFEHHLSELQGENEILTKENETLKNNLKEIGYEFKKYSYEETEKKIEDYNTEKLLISLLQNIINDLQNDWRVVDYTSDFTNDLDLKTNQVVTRNISIDIKLKMDGIKWLMIGKTNDLKKV